MDIALLNRGWNRTWSDTMVNLESRKLVETANRLSAFYLQDGLTRIKFVGEIKQVVEKEFETARRAKTDEECIVCIKNLRAETNSLLEQERLLRTKSSQLFAKVEFFKENNKIVGYMISAIHIVVSGMAIAGGALMVATMTPLGMLAGAILVTEAWRLFKWMHRDFYRKVDAMSRPKLTMKIVGYGLKAKVIFDLLSTDTSNH